MSRNLTTIPPVVSSEISDTVYTAVLEEKRFQATYRTVSRKIKTYLVNPLGLTFVDGLTYLIASLNEHTDPVLLLLHRILSVDLLNTPVNIPDGFSLDDWVSELLTFPVGDAIMLKLRFTSSADIQRLEESPLSEDQKVIRVSDGIFELTANVEDTKQLRWWLHGFGARVEVIEPQDLRQEFVQLAVQYSGLYGKGAPKTT
jgi:predicted DNA-binding transcriptional regulator YafY